MMKHQLSYISATNVIVIFGVAALILACLDILGGAYLASLYNKSKYNISHVAGTIKPELLIFGSSTAARGLDPEVFENELGSKSYSFAQDGTDIFYSTVLIRNLPPAGSVDTVVWGIDPASFATGFDNANFKQIIRLAPYLERDEIVERYIALNDEWLWLKRISKAYPYVPQVKQMVKDMLLGRYEDPRNFVGLTGQMEAAKGQVESKEKKAALQVKEEAREVLHLIAEQAEKKDFKLVLVTTPLYNRPVRSQWPEYAEVMQVIEEQLGGDRVCNLTTFESEDVKGLTADPSLFFDGPHLNKEGAKRYSRIIATEIKRNCFR